jgi:polyphenol oxidase
VSRGVYGTANLGAHVGDDPAAVHENRNRLARSFRAAAPAAPADPRDWVWLRQVHGAAVVTVDDVAAREPAPDADAAVTACVGVPLVVLVADCAPIALIGERAVGVAHAGWAGLEQGVVEQAVGALRALDAGEVHAVLGPCIRPGRYEFGPDDLARLVDRFGPGVAGTTDWGSPALDLPAAVAIALGRAGVDAFTDVGTCTSTSPDHFSHRRDGTTGRQAVVVMLER